MKPPSDEFAPPSGPSLKARAVGLLSRREHSRLELGRKLSRYGADADEINTVLDQLEKEGWLSNERFAQSLVHRLAPKKGAALVVRELRQHGVDADQVDSVRQTLQASELARAQQVWSKRFHALPVDPTERGKQVRFLMSRGFSHAAIRQVLSGVDLDDLGEE